MALPTIFGLAAGYIDGFIEGWSCCCCSNCARGEQELYIDWLPGSREESQYPTRYV
jgi:hypothetical protein